MGILIVGKEPREKDTDPISATETDRTGRRTGEGGEGRGGSLRGWRRVYRTLQFAGQERRR